MATFSVNERVFVNGGVPLRYQDRAGIVTGTVPRGRGVQYLVAFPGRRAEPLRVSGANLTPAQSTDGWTGRYTR